MIDFSGSAKRIEEVDKARDPPAARFSTRSGKRRSDVVSAMSDDDKKATEGTADGAGTLKHIGGSQSESSPHTRSANALADGIASQVALARRFNIRLMLRIGNAKTPMKTTLVAVLRLENPKPQMAWNGVYDGGRRIIEDSSLRRLLGRLPGWRRHGRRRTRHRSSKLAFRLAHACAWLPGHDVATPS
jgi:hypothetical protein